MKIEGVDRHYLLMEYYLQSFTYMEWDPFMGHNPSKQKSMRRIIKNELIRRKNEK